MILKNWWHQHTNGTQPHSNYVPFYTINNINDIFIMFTTKQLFQQINASAIQEFNHPCFINHNFYISNTHILLHIWLLQVLNKKMLRQSRRLMCWSHMIRKVRKHRSLVPKDLWSSIDADIHSLQLSFSDDVFNRGVKLMLNKSDGIPRMKKFSEYFVDQWVTKLPYW
jgi:hypothetical protein